MASSYLCKPANHLSGSTNGQFFSPIRALWQSSLSDFRHPEATALAAVEPQLFTSLFLEEKRWNSPDGTNFLLSPFGFPLGGSIT
jgi:hypothetical protein